MRMRFAMITGSLAFALLAAGCTATDEEATSDDPVSSCGPYATVHYERAPEQRALRETFEKAHYAWTQRTDRIAEATSPSGGLIVLSHVPGSSGDDLVVSTEGPQAQQWAIAAAGLVNATGGDPRVTQWTVGERC